ncbi:hypothetical protein [Altererythrobacter sp. GH1-8]|uniref:hypothetical protein n=1 Tax=Altererythrobacter sp. GH1-8 TaxID=3349333 RepID=UPI00374CA61F
MSSIRTIALAACLALPLLACGGTSERGADEDANTAEAPLSDMQRNSAIRQCVSVAVIQQVPSEAAKDICDCTVNRLIDAGEMTAQTMPDDAQQQRTLDACMAEYEPDGTSAAQ